MRTWKISKYGITVKALKKDAERLNRMIGKIDGLVAYARETTGVVGGESSTCILWTSHSRGEVRNAEQYKEKLQTWVEGMRPHVGHVVQASEIPDLLGVGQAIFDDHVPESDKRLTTDEVQERDERIKEASEKRDEQGEKFLAEWTTGEPATVPEGKMGVLISVTFDDSDSMSDYFHPFASIGPEMLLATVPKGRAMEARAREVVGRYPELAKLEWTWHKENYSMGRGYYLCSEYIDAEDTGHHYYRGGDVTRVRFSVDFNKYSGGKELPAFRGFPGMSERQQEHIARFVGKASMALNEERDGVEVMFKEKPDDRVIFALKEAGFRWSGRQKLWYAKQSGERIALAKRITDTFNPKAATP